MTREAVSLSDQFIADYREGGLIFFTGAGASWDSGAAMPPEILRASAELFLPTGPRYAKDLAEVLQGKGAAGAPLDGIQPEIFYENLLAVADDPAALILWRALSPHWLGSRGTRLEPNGNHFAIAAHAARHGLPVFTVNFDMLFETAAGQLGIPIDVTVVRPGEAVRRTGFEKGVMSLFKLHGSILVDGREALDSLGTTMQAISAVNQPMLDLLATFARSHTLAFVGYSGCDIDYFPVLAGSEFARPPYWFNPLGDPVTRSHAERLGARILDDYPAKTFARLEPDLPVPERLDSASLLEELKASVTLRLADRQKLYFLALCLHSVGRNDAAGRILAELGQEMAGLPPDNRVGALLLRARVEDCTSDYIRSAASARAALRAVKAAVQAGAIDEAQYVGLRARGLYHLGMARQQQIGPSIAYGDPSVDWRPGLSAMLGRLLAGIFLSIRLSLAKRRLHRLAGGVRRLEFLRAEHAINDHTIMLLGGVMTMLERFRMTRLPPVRAAFIALVSGIRRQASRSGDYYSYAHALKYLNRLRRVEMPVEAIETYGLLRDPLNYALVCRDAGVRHLQDGDRPRAAYAFRLALDASLACGSRSTALKSLVGLASAGALTEDDRRDLRALGARLEGAGYVRYWREKARAAADDLQPSDRS
ncbi:MAG: SIR2-like domain [Sphingomonadales bacterium]|nr:SIR2-like domain [Sphingomonadales bacterium]